MERTLSTEDAAAICRHMNDDHADAIAGYARTYGEIAHVDSAQIVALDQDAMELAVEAGPERIVTRIRFDHVLADTEDARVTLIAMARHAAAGSSS